MSRPVSILSMLTLLAGCATNPVSGKRELNLMSQSQELALGAQSDKSIVAQYGEYPDEDLQAYIASIGERMVPVSHRPDLDFHFRLLDDSIVNAFALPGGYVYITRGILAYLNDDAALAGVIGHEIGHVTARHGAQRYTQQMLMGAGLVVGSILSPQIARHGDLVGAGAQLLLLKYGRDDERQSDQLGVEYATKIGYDTRGMAEFFGTLDRLSGGAEGRLPEWQSTHPDPGARFETVQSLTAQWQAQVGKPPYKSDRDGFLARIDGIVFGDDPRKGFVDAGKFLHPDLKFQFPTPSGWKVVNSAARVVVAHPDGNAGVIFMLESAKTVEAAADEQSRQEGVQVVSREGYTLGGMPAVRMESATSDGHVINSTFIAYDGNIYGFHGIAPRDSYDGLQRMLELPADGFRPLTDPKVLAIQPIVVKVVTAAKASSFVEFARGYPIPEGANMTVDGLALLNGVQTGSWVEKGHKFKILVRRSAVTRSGRD
jgi:predicted Zn-dependent protease